MIELEYPLVCLDVETTGDMPKIDRVVQIAILKIYPDGRRNEWQTLVNPTIPIPAGATAVHGISDEDVAQAPTFEDIWMKLAQGLSKCDYVGYNLARFDLPLLAEEFRRVRAKPETFMNGRVVDVFKIYQRYATRTLTDAVRLYLGRGHEGAHDAMADVRATMAVFESQLTVHEDLPRSVEGIHHMLFEDVSEGYLDPDRKIAVRGDQLIIAFGKNTSGKNIRHVDDGFLKWVMRGEFTPIVKEACRAELERRTHGRRVYDE